MLKAQILEFDRMITVWHRSNETSKRLDEIPGVGPALATALVASVVDPKAFRSGRDFSAWIGLVPKQHSQVSAARAGPRVRFSRPPVGNQLTGLPSVTQWSHVGQRLAVVFAADWRRPCNIVIS
jgi:hypothetical protein